MKFNFRKIASALASAAMLGSTVAIAAAANFPAPFVQNGAADVAIVYQNNLDLGAVTDISTALSSAMSSSGNASTAGTTPTGDYVLLAKASDKLNMGNVISTIFGSTVDDDDLEDLLANGVYTNDENTEYDFEQKVTLGSALQVQHFADSDYNNKEPTVGINLTSSEWVLNYTLSFIDQPESDVSSGDLVDFETTNFRLLGRDYFVLDAKNATNVKLTLLDSANTATVSEGESTTVSVGSKTYSAEIVFIGSSEVKLKINGETTSSLAEGGTYKLSDGTYIGIKDILVQDYSGGVKKVEFSIGSGKLEMTSASNIKLNDNTVSGMLSKINMGTSTSGKEKISSIVIEWRTDDEEFLTSETELVMPGFKALKFSANEFTPSEDDFEMTTVSNSGSTKMRLRADVKDGIIDVPFLYSNASGEFTGIGEEANKDMLTSFGLTGLLYNKSTHEYLIASWNSTRDAETYLLKFEQYDNTDGINYTTPEKYVDGSWVGACGTKSDSGGSTPSCDIGSLSLTLNKISGKDSYGGKFVNFTGNAGSSFYRVYTKEGLEINLPVNIATDVQGATATADGAINLSNFTAGATNISGHNQESFFLMVSEEDKDGNVGVGSSINITIDDQSDGDLEVSAVTSGGSDNSIKSLENEDNLIARVESDVATEFWRLGSSSSQRSAKINYPGDQSYLETFLTGSGSSGGSGGELGNVNILASELAASTTMSGKNLIVVGGSCVNSVASTLLGTGAGCGASWTAKTSAGTGEWIIQTFANPWGASKVATLVAGWEAGDTQNAATYLTTQSNVDTSVGKKLTGTTATAATSVTV